MRELKTPANVTKSYIIYPSQKTKYYLLDKLLIGEKMSRLIGYARVSTQEQELQLQMDALEKAGCDKNKIFVDKISGTKAERPGLNKCLTELKPGDTLLVWRLDRLGRSMPHLVSLIEELKTKDIGFKSICDGAIDTTTASGELMGCQSQTADFFEIYMKALPLLSYS